jgi:2-phospho-L-lactate/phosphoenolpyruvate guanylyltransferase
MRDGTYAVIPVKAFALAKRRLAPILDGFERTQLARLMLEDVIDAVRAAQSVSGFCIVTAHQDAARLAEQAGGAVVWEAAEFGFAHAVATAQRKLASHGGGMIVIPSDIPHLPSATIDAVNAATPERGIAILPATSDGGTNLLAIRPCDLIPPLFGPRSFDRHRARAMRAGLVVAICTCPLAGHDLDRPDDLPAFLALDSRSRAQDYLAGLDIADRLADLKRKPPAPYAAALA